MNVRGANCVYNDAKFRRFYDICSFITIDGFGILFGMKLLGYKVKSEHRFTCPNYLDSLLESLSDKEISIYFLGSTQKISEKLNINLSNNYPKLKFRCHHGYFRKEGAENQQIIKDINDFEPNILYLGFGMPLQEYWILDNYEKINTNIFLPLGACIDFHTNSVYRGPRIFTDNGFEWLTRLITEPKRLWFRYIIGNPLFMIRILVERVKHFK